MAYRRPPRTANRGPRARASAAPPLRPDRRHRAFFFGLEDRTLLTGVIDLALSLPIGHALVGTLAPFGASFYKVDVASPGRLTADVVAKGFPSRLSFVDAQGHPLLQSDAPSIDTGRRFRCHRGWE